jgi:hypothetical protein
MEGAVVAAGVPHGRASLANASQMVQASGLRAASALLYAEPKDVVAAAATPEQALDALEGFYQAIGGSVNRDSNIGYLRRTDIQRLMARVRRTLGDTPDPALHRRCARVERNLHLALGLQDHRWVYLHPRQHFHAVIPLARLTNIPHEIPRLLLNAGSALPRRHAARQRAGSPTATATPTATTEPSATEDLNGSPTATATPTATTPATKSPGQQAADQVNTSRQNAVSDNQKTQAALAKYKDASTTDVKTGNVTVKGASETGNVVQVAELKKEQWKQVFEQNNLFRGWLITAEGPKPAKKMMWDWDGATQNWAVDDNSRVEATLCNSLSAATSVSAGFTSSSATVGAGTPTGASVGLSAGSSSGKHDSTATKNEKAQKVTQWMFPRANVWPQASLKLSKEFLSELNAINTVSGARAKATKLVSMLETYGDFYPESVLLGGKYYLIETSETKSSALAGASTKTVSAGMSLGYGPFSGSASTASTDTKSTASNTSKGNANSTARSTGGNALLSGNPTAWTTSLADWTFWRTIQFGKMEKITSYLPPKYTQMINELQNSREFALIYQDPEMRAKNLRNAKKFDKQYVWIKFGSDLHLGTLALAKSGDCALFRAGITRRPFDQTILWKVEQTDASIRLKASTEASLWLTMDNSGNVLLRPPLEGTEQQQQCWSLQETTGGQFKLINQNTTLQSSMDLKCGPKVATATLNVVPKNIPDVYGVYYVGESTEYGEFEAHAEKFWTAVDDVINKLDGPQWQYLFLAWQDRPAQFKMWCEENQGECNTYNWSTDITLGRRQSYSNKKGVLVHVKDAFMKAVTRFRVDTQNQEGSISITYLKYNCEFPNVASLAPADAKCYQAIAASAVDTDNNKETFTIHAVVDPDLALMPSAEKLGSWSTPQ